MNFTGLVNGEKENDGESKNSSIITSFRVKNFYCPSSRFIDTFDPCLYDSYYSIKFNV
jgi:hypothetical protein